MDGYAWSPASHDRLRRHRSICHWQELLPPDKYLDDTAIQGIAEFLEERGLSLVKRAP